MKNQLLTLSMFLLGCASCWAQKINYESSLEKAERRARKENKILCLLITDQSPGHLNEKMAGLTDPIVIARLNEHFVNYWIDTSDSWSVPIVKKYELKRFPVFVLTDSDNRLLAKRTGNRPSSMISEMLDKAIADKQYLSGDRSNSFLRYYINKRINAGITSNADLIDEYVKTLPASDLNSYQEIVFILKAGPLIDGPVYALINTNRKMIDSVYKTELYVARDSINTRMSNNTMAKAIAQKNLSMAHTAANFIAWTWQSKDTHAMQRDADGKLDQYYLGIKDTIGYLRHLVSHYKRFYLHISTDSIRNLDKKNELIARNYARELAASGKTSGNGLKFSGYTFGSIEYSMMLNIGAICVLGTDTKDSAFLSAATSWASRAVELNPNSYNHETLAKLQYRLGHYLLAEVTLQKAIELHKAAKQDTKKMEEDLTKINKRTL